MAQVNRHLYNDLNQTDVISTFIKARSPHSNWKIQNTITYGRGNPFISFISIQL